MLIEHQDRSLLLSKYCAYNHEHLASLLCKQVTSTMMHSWVCVFVSGRIRFCVSKRTFKKSPEQRSLLKCLALCRFSLVVIHFSSTNLDETGRLCQRASLTKRWCLRRYSNTADSRERSLAYPILPVGWNQKERSKNAPGGSMKIKKIYRHSRGNVLCCDRWCIALWKKWNLT